MNRRSLLAGFSALAVSGAVAYRPFDVRPQLLAWLDEDTERARLEFLSVVSEMGGEDFLRAINTEVRWIPSNYDVIDVEDLSAKLSALEADVCFAVSHQAVIGLQERLPELKQVVLSNLDPIEIGIIDDYFAPGRNTTGVSLDALDPYKPLETICALLPRDEGRQVGILVAPEWATERRKQACEQAARDLSISIVLCVCDGPDEAAKLIMVRDAVQGWWIPESLLVESRSKRALVLRALLAARKLHLFGRPIACSEGAMLCVSTAPIDWHRSAAHVLRMVLEGVDPSYIPFQRPTGWVYAVNEVSLKTLGVSLPPELTVMLGHDLSGIGKY
jgi:ABC-type uncharacterized transport system substrate-binding protein